MPIDATARARAVGIDAQYQDLRNGGGGNLPQRIFVLAQGNADATYSSVKFRALSAKQVAATKGAGYGSPAHLVARELFPDNGDGVGTVPVTMVLLQQGYDSSPATGSITPAGSQTQAAEYRVIVNGIKSAKFVVDAAESVASRCDKIVAAINAVLEMPVIATDNTTNVGIASKWNGASANDIVVEVEGTLYGGTFAVVQPSGGLVNPSADEITEALEQIGNVWETLVINALNISDTDVLAAINEVGEGRWGVLVHKPFVCFTGNTEADATTATTVTAARSTDRINCQLVAPGSPNLPCVVAARQVARIAVMANNNPPTDYAGLKANRLTPGTDGQQWDYPTKDFAVKAGSSTVDVVAGVIEMSDTVTMASAEDDALPPYRFVCDIIKVMNLVYRLDVIFGSDDWKGKVLIPDNQVTTNPNARKPKAAKAAYAGMIDQAALDAIISDPEFAKKNTTASIDTDNPRRINVQGTVKISGNTGIVDVGINWGFHLGTAPVAA